MCQDFLLSRPVLSVFSTLGLQHGPRHTPPASFKTGWVQQRSPHYGAFRDGLLTLPMMSCCKPVTNNIPALIMFAGLIRIPVLDSLSFFRVGG